MGGAQFSRRERTTRVLVVAFCLVGLISSCAARLSVSKQRLEVHKHLNRLNKPAMKSVKSPDGDVIDSVDISHQQRRRMLKCEGGK